MAVVEVGVLPFLIRYYNQVHWRVCGFEGGEVEVVVELFMCWDKFELVGWEVC